jgi:hypothetical protein
VTPTSDSYLQISFGSAAGKLAPGGGWATCQIDVHTAGYINSIDPANDYSYDSAANVTYVAWDHITAYLNGSLVWGVEPTPSVADAGVDAAVASDAGNDSGTIDAAVASDAGNDSGSIDAQPLDSSVDATVGAEAGGAESGTAIDEGGQGDAGDGAGDDGSAPSVPDAVGGDSTLGDAPLDAGTSNDEAGDASVE